MPRGHAEAEAMPPWLFERGSCIYGAQIGTSGAESMVRLAGWQQAAGLDTFARARHRTQELLGGCTRPAIAIDHERGLSRQMQSVAAAAGMAHIPEAGWPRRSEIHPLPGGESLPHETSKKSLRGEGPTRRQSGDPAPKKRGAPSGAMLGKSAYPFLIQLAGCAKTGSGQRLFGIAMH